MSISWLQVIIEHFYSIEYEKRKAKKKTLHFRNGPNDIKDPYGLSPHYWHVFAARLAFVVVFEVYIN